MKELQSSLSIFKVKLALSVAEVVEEIYSQLQKDGRITKVGYQPFVF